MKTHRPVSRVFAALNRLHLPASRCEHIIRLARHTGWSPQKEAVRDMALDILRSAIQLRHRTRGWRNEMRTVLTREQPKR